MGSSPSFSYEAMAIAVKLTQHTPVNIADCSQPFFSEYIEGSSNNKALEIFNPTANSIDLSGYQIRRYNNGATTPSSTTSIVGTVASNDVFVIANTSADQAILNVADMLSNNVIGYNGNDAIELYDVANSMVIDVIGVVGVNPGSSWIVGTGSTANNTLVRKATVKAGTDVWIGFADQQWNVLSNNDFTNIGMHTNSGCFTPQTPLVAIPSLSADTICEGETVQFTNASTGGTTPYTVAWNFGNGNTSTNSSDSFTYSTIGVYQISLNVTDNLGATDDSIFYVVVNALPSSGMTIPNLACSGATIVISPSNYNAAFTYNYTDGSTTLSDVNGVVNYSNNAGTYSISQTVTSVSGYSSVATQTLVVKQSPIASFTHTGSPVVNFTDASTNSVTWTWSFGDGTTSAIQNPTHTYVGNGNFDASLLVTAVNGCSDTTTNSISVGIPSSINEVSTMAVSIFPNPVKEGVLTIKTQEEIKEVTVLNLLGQNVISSIGNVKTINTSGLVLGTYFVKVKTANGTIVQKLIKE